MPPPRKVAGSSEFIIINVSVPESHGRCAMAMLQLEDSSATSPEGPPCRWYCRRASPIVMKLQPGPVPWGAASAVIPAIGAISDWKRVVGAGVGAGAGEADGAGAGGGWTCCAGADGAAAAVTAKTSRA